MDLVVSPFSTIQENLSLEQFLLRKQGDFLVLYKNRNCIVIGRNQVVYSEISIRVQHSKDLPVFRRNSGGGAVFHDEGTLNYAFISDYKQNCNSYSCFNQIVIKALNEIGLDYIAEKGCNIYYKDYKISGTAQYKRKNRIIHHGSLLISADLHLLDSIFCQSGSYKTKAKRSVAAQTMNLSNIFPDVPVNVFEERICYSFKRLCSERIALAEDVYSFVARQKVIFEEKSWTYGNTPDYEFSNEILLPSGTNLHISFKVRRGIVTNQELSHNTTLSGSKFIGLYHSFEEFYPVISNALGKAYTVEEVNNICYQFFNSELRA
jgi:lipoate---protein ligase